VRENAADKGRRYLTEGRVIITVVGDGQVDAIVRGDGIRHAVAWRPDTWTCTCPARGACSHLLAVRSVVATDLLGRAQR
jgi:uncharacterized Zn finger protein